MQIQVPVRSEEECKNAYRNFKTTVIDNRILCAGYTRGGKDSCRVRNNCKICNRKLLRSLSANQIVVSILYKF